MKQIDFSPYNTSSIIIKFECNECKGKVISEDIYVPSPNYMAERSRDSDNYNEGYAFCENCDKEFEIEVCVGFGGGLISIEGIDEEIDVEIIEDEYIEEQIETYIDSSEFFNTFQQEINYLKKLNQLSLDKELKRTLQRQIFSGSITCLEDYLSSRLINNVLKDDELFEKFVKNYKNMENRTFQLNEIFDKYRGLEKTVKIELLDIIYHNIPKVKGIYEKVFEIKFPEITSVCEIVSDRHNMVHRNGKDKQGNEIEINDKKIIDILDTVENFIKQIDDSIENSFM